MHATRNSHFIVISFGFCFISLKLWTIFFPRIFNNLFNAVAQSTFSLMAPIFEMRFSVRCDVPCIVFFALHNTRSLERENRTEILNHQLINQNEIWVNRKEKKITFPKFHIQYQDVNDTNCSIPQLHWKWLGTLLLSFLFYFIQFQLIHLHIEQSEFSFYSIYWTEMWSIDLMNGRKKYYFNLFYIGMLTQYLVQCNPSMHLLPWDCVGQRHNL